MCSPVKATQCKGGASHKVHITFDDGPRVPETEMVLDKLAQEEPKVKATFFISTSHFAFVLEKKPESYTSKEKKMIQVLRRIKEEGHVLGSHSCNHLNHADTSDERRSDIDSNLKDNNKIWSQLGLKKPAPFRFPYGAGWFGEEGADTSQSMSKIKAQGFQPVHWDIDSWDWSKYKRKALPDSVLQQICTHQGGVALFHDVQSFTAQNIDVIMEAIKSAGHKMVSLADIREESERLIQPKHSFRDRVVGIFNCGKRVGQIDQVWGSCSEYDEKSYNERGSQSID